LKTNIEGYFKWQRYFGKVQGRNDELFDVVETHDGNLAAVGGAMSYNSQGSMQILLVKTDQSGNLFWLRTMDGAANSLREYYDGGYILVGHPLMTKTDSTGKVLWTIPLPGNLSTGGAKSLCITSDSCIMVAGATSAAQPGQRSTTAWLVKTDQNGNPFWSKTYRGPYPGYNYIFSIQNSNNDGYVLAGFSNAFDPMGLNYCGRLVRTDSKGDTLWSKLYNKGFGVNLKSVIRTFDKGFLLVGKIDNLKTEFETHSDGLVIKTDENGNEIWSMTVGGDNHDWFEDAAEISRGQYILTGGTQSYGHGYADIWLVRISTGANNVEEIESPKSYMLFQNHPNPFNQSTTIPFYLLKSEFVTLEIYDLLGKKVATLINGFWAAGYHSCFWNPIDQPSGIYHYRLKAGPFEDCKKVLLIR
jgi:hypothetical protein